MKPIIIFLTSVFLLLFSDRSNAQKILPNILVFIADDAGMDFGCYGNKGIQTPTIDQLSEEGMKFTNAFLTCSQCSPTRTSLLSGRFAHTIGTEDLHTPLGPGIKIIPTYLQTKGYYTGLMLKGHIGENGMKQFNWYDNGMSEYRKGIWNEKVLTHFSTFLDSSLGKPFFMWCAFIDPHRPYGDSLNGAPNVHHEEDVVVPPYLVDSESTRKDLAQYYDEIHRIDKHIGIILNELKRRNIYDNTLVIFFSDNGYPFPRGKASLYDAGIKTPLIMKWQDHIGAGTNYDELVSLIDLAPTILESAGISSPEEFYGQSLFPVFRNKFAPGRDYIFAERNWHDSDAHMRCIRTKKYKLIVNSYPWLPFPITGDYSKSGSWSVLLKGQADNTLNEAQKRIFEFPRPSVELYDLENDPYELVNLSIKQEYTEVMESLNNKLLDWQVETGDSLASRIPRRDIVDRKSGFLYNLQRNKELDEEIINY